MATDDFNRADETPLASPWVKETGSDAVNANLASNQLTSSGTGNKLYYLTGAATSADQYAQIKSNSGTADGGPAARVSATGGLNGYLISFTSGNLGKYVAGSFSVISGTGDTYAAGNTIRMECQGSTIRFYKNGVASPNSPQTDTSLTVAGHGVGFSLFDSANLDDFDGGDLAGAAAVIMLPVFEAIPFMSNQRI